MESHEAKDKESFMPNFQYDRWLSSPPPGDEVVISGMSGHFPEAENIFEFRDNLFNKKDMITVNDKRWVADHHDLPKRNAPIDNIDKLDAGYFGLHYRQVNFMDPTLRVLMETVIEAVMDAGINPSELKGCNTAVFLGLCWSELEYPTLMKLTEQQKFAITG
mgnify:CR=1 FL=1